MNVTDYIKSNFCVGCGICVSLCPTKHLDIAYNNNKLFVQENSNVCLEKCDICLSVCPFSNQSSNEDVIGEKLYKAISDIHHAPECGYYLNCYVGYHPEYDYRMQSASGGLTSYLLDYLLREGEIDTAIVVERNDEKPFFSYTYCKSSQEIYNYSRSAYYAIHADQIIDQIIHDPSIQNIAIVALPCLSKAIRNACSRNYKLKSKVKYIIGLTCGQQKSHNFSEFLAEKEKIVDLINIDFRIKDSQHKNGDYGVTLKSKNEEKRIQFSSYAKEWSLGLFKVPACHFCDDIFAETADVTFMDAWLPEYAESSKGENLVITRSEAIDKMMKQVSGIIPISIQRAFESQQIVIKTKRCFIMEHLKLAKKTEAYVPFKREYLLKEPALLEKCLIRIKYELSIQSDQLWLASERKYEIFRKKLRKYQFFLYVGLIANKIHVILTR